MEEGPLIVPKVEYYQCPECGFVLMKGRYPKVANPKEKVPHYCGYGLPDGTSKDIRIKETCFIPVEVTLK